MQYWKYRCWFFNFSCVWLHWFYYWLSFMNFQLGKINRFQKLKYSKESLKNLCVTLKILKTSLCQHNHFFSMYNSQYELKLNHEKFTFFAEIELARYNHFNNIMWTIFIPSHGFFEYFDYIVSYINFVYIKIPRKWNHWCYNLRLYSWKNMSTPI